MSSAKELTAVDKGFDGEVVKLTPQERIQQHTMTAAADC